MDLITKLVDRLDMGDKVERNFRNSFEVLVLKCPEFRGFGLVVYLVC